MIKYSFLGFGRVLDNLVIYLPRQFLKDLTPLFVVGIEESLEEYAAATKCVEHIYSGSGSKTRHGQLSSG